MKLQLQIRKYVKQKQKTYQKLNPFIVYEVKKHGNQYKKKLPSNFMQATKDKEYYSIPMIRYDKKLFRRTKK